MLLVEAGVGGAFSGFTSNFRSSVNKGFSSEAGAEVSYANVFRCPENNAGFIYWDLSVAALYFSLKRETSVSESVIPKVFKVVSSDNRLYVFSICLCKLVYFANAFLCISRSAESCISKSSDFIGRPPPTVSTSTAFMTITT